MKLFKGKRMKFFIIVSLIFQLSTTLWAEKNYKEYMKTKEIVYELYENGDKRDAISHIRSFIATHPKSLRAQNLLAVLYYWNGELDKSKNILKSILKKEKFPLSVTLLQSIAQREGTTVQQLLGSKHTSTTKLLTDDVKAMIASVKKNPQDFVSMKILAKYYRSIGDIDEANYYADKVLQINPDDSHMIAILRDDDTSLKNSKQIVAKALEKLEFYNLNGKHDRFMNLYSSLEHNNIMMPTKIHVDALYSSIALGDYKKAKSILHIYRMPQNKYLAQVETLLDGRLLSSRFAKCTGATCSSGR
jgi:tetratricopeptide (TPR) repeat protein